MKLLPYSPTARWTAGILVSAVLAASAQGAATQQAKYRSGTILVAFNSNVSDSTQRFWYSFFGGGEQRRMGQGVHMLQVPAGLETAVIQFMKATGGVKYAELDYQHKATAGAIPNDSYFSNQWGLLNTGQLVNGYGGPSGADVKAVPAWSVSTGSNSVVVAVLDTGAQYSHPDLFTNMWNNPGGINGCPVGTHGYNVLAGNCDPMDDETWYGGHGTHVSGIIGALGNNGPGITGANWTTSIMPVKWISADATGYTSDLISAMDWVIRAKQAGVNIKVVNDSATWPGDSFSQALSDEIDALGANDILFVGASGNQSSNNDTTPVYPCSYNRPTQLCVAALDMDNSLWVASNWGPTTVHLGAPGAAIFSTLRQSNYGIISGASMSAALVSGAAALVLSNGNLPVATLKSTLLSSVDQQPSLVGRTVTGGSLNLCKALATCGSTPFAPTLQSPPVVTGVPQFGSVVAASTGKWAGLPTGFSYQWLRCDSRGANCQTIPGATSALYGIFGASDAGSTLAVTVTASNTIATASATSPASAVVASVSPAFTLNSSIANGSVLTGSVTWQASSPQPLNFVEFYIDGTLSQTDTASPFLYNGATNSLFDPTKLTPGTHTLGLRGLTSDNRTYSYFAATITTGGGPVNTGLPAISGTPSIGGTLQVSTGTWSGAPTGYTYQWLRCDTSGNNCSNISGATANSYVVSGADANTTLRGSVTASNANGSNAARSAAVLISAPAITTASLPSGTVGSAYSAQLAVSGGTSPYTWSAISGSLPGGLSLNTSSGLISGTPQTNGAFSFTIQVADSNGQIATRPLSINIGPAAPSITTTSLSSGVAGSLYSAQLTASGGTAPFTWSVTSGNIPAGLTLAPSTGAISGTPQTAGNFNFTIQVSDANSLTSSKTLSITIAAAPTPIALVQSNSSEGTKVASLAASFTSANKSGNLIVVFMRISSSNQTVTVADSAGNTYAQAVSQVQAADGHQTFIFYARNVKGRTNKVTATFSAANNHPFVAVYEFSGLTQLDQTASTQAVDSSAISVGPVNTATANELIFIGAGFPYAWGGSVTADTPDTLSQQDTNTSRAASEYRIVSAAGSYPGALSLSATANWSALMATFK